MKMALIRVLEFGKFLLRLSPACVFCLLGGFCLGRFFQPPFLDINTLIEGYLTLVFFWGAWLFRPRIR